MNPGHPHPPFYGQGPFRNLQWIIESAMRSNPETRAKMGRPQTWPQEEALCLCNQCEDFIRHWCRSKHCSCCEFNCRVGAVEVRESRFPE